MNNKKIVQIIVIILVIISLILLGLGFYLMRTGNYTNNSTDNKPTESTTTNNTEEKTDTTNQTQEQTTVQQPTSYEEDKYDKTVVVQGVGTLQILDKNGKEVFKVNNKSTDEVSKDKQGHIYMVNEGNSEEQYIVAEVYKNEYTVKASGKGITGIEISAIESNGDIYSSIKADNISLGSNYLVAQTRYGQQTANAITIQNKKGVVVQQVNASYQIVN